MHDYYRREEARYTRVARSMSDPRARMLLADLALGYRALADAAYAQELDPAPEPAKS